MTVWLQIGLAVTMALVTIMQISVLLGFRTGRFTASTDGSNKEFDRRLREQERRMNHAGEQSSKMATAVQGLVGRIDRLPEELRQKFVGRDTIEMLVQEWHRDRDALWKACGDRRREERD